MSRFALLLKSYRGDYEFARRLVDSFTPHNPSGLRLYVVVPEEDLGLFVPLASEAITVLSEEPLRHHFTDTQVNGIRPGYINQEIVKLSFWELDLADAYFCVDSDAVFVRDLDVTDFLAPDGHPYTVLVEDNELKVEPQYFAEHWQPREQAIKRIAQEIGWDEPILRTCHGHQVFASAVLRSFRDEFLGPRGWDYLDALRIAPYEFSWYNIWLQASGVIPIHQREPLVKVFHNSSQHLEYLLRGVGPEDIARGYLGLVIQSNFSRDIEVQPIHASKPESLSHYLSYGELGSLTAAKVRASLRRLRRR